MHAQTSASRSSRSASAGGSDATNIVDPDVAVITTVDIDHTDWLGPDVESIGFEKAGIARPWTPLVLGDDDPPSSVLRHAYAIGARALRIGCDFFVERHAGGWRWRDVGHAVELPLPALAAPAQLRNAAVAIAALRAAGIDTPDEALRAGVAGARLPGRLQTFDEDGAEVVVDVAHNPQAARELAGWLGAVPARGRTHALFAALGDKDAAGIVGALDGRIDAWHVAGLPGHGPRALDVDAFAPLSRTPQPRPHGAGSTSPPRSRRCARRSHPVTGCWCSARSTPPPMPCACSIAASAAGPERRCAAPGRGGVPRIIPATRRAAPAASGTRWNLP